MAGTNVVAHPGAGNYSGAQLKLIRDTVAANRRFFRYLVQ